MVESLLSWNPVLSTASVSAVLSVSVLSVASESVTCFWVFVLQPVTQNELASTVAPSIMVASNCFFFM